MHVVWLDEFQVASGGTPMAVGQAVELQVITPSLDWLAWFEPVFGDVATTVTAVEEHHNQIHLTHRLAGRVESIRVAVARFGPTTDPRGGTAPAAGSGRLVEATSVKPTTPGVELDGTEDVLGFFAEISSPGV